MTTTTTTSPVAPSAHERTDDRALAGFSVHIQNKDRRVRLVAAGPRWMRMEYWLAPSRRAQRDRGAWVPTRRDYFTRVDDAAAGRWLAERSVWAKPSELVKALRQSGTRLARNSKTGLVERVPAYSPSLVVDDAYDAAMADWMERYASAHLGTEVRFYRVGRAATNAARNAARPRYTPTTVAA